MAERNLLLRIASALVLIPLVFALVLWREPLGFAVAGPAGRRHRPG